LSYSHFEYRELQCVDTVDTHGAVEVSVVLVNESELAGTEVVQLYFQDPVAEVTRPLRQLAGFQRLQLAPGQSKRVVFQLDVSQFAYYNPKLEYIVDPGRIELMVGASSTDIRSRKRLTVQGDRRLFKQQQQLATQSHDQDISP
jgi:beta-glucosidase